MKLSPFAAALAIGAGTFLLATLVQAHGGTYRGPGDTVPGSGGGGGGGGTTPGPANPGGGGTTTGGGTGPSKPSGGGTPTGGPGGRGGGASTGTIEQDLSDWEFWCNFNKERFLGLRSALY